jgi:hypothetical protein
MKKQQLAFVYLLTILVLFLAGACDQTQTAEQASLSVTIPAKTQTPTPEPATITPTLPPTGTPTIEPSKTPTLTLSPTMELISPTLTISPSLGITTDLDCYVLTWVEDVTIPDGTELSPGEIFMKVWRVQNSGTCAWGYNFLISYDYGDRMSGPEITRAHFFSPDNRPKLEFGDPTWQEEVFDVFPGDIVDLVILLKAPDGPGEYRGVWRFSSFEEIAIDYLWVDIKVPEGIVREDSDWSGEWSHIGPAGLNLAGFPLILSQSLEGILGYFYTFDGRIMLVDGEVSADGLRVEGSWGEPYQSGELIFLWQLLEGYNQFEGTYWLGNFGSDHWCGARSEQDIPAICEPEP